MCTGLTTILRLKPSRYLQYPSGVPKFARTYSKDVEILYPISAAASVERNSVVVVDMSGMLEKKTDQQGNT